MAVGPVSSEQIDVGIETVEYPYVNVVGDI